LFLLRPRGTACSSGSFGWVGTLGCSIATAIHLCNQCDKVSCSQHFMWKHQRQQFGHFGYLHSYGRWRRYVHIYLVTFAEDNDMCEWAGFLLFGCEESHSRAVLHEHATVVALLSH
jgi:hypothetical protein